MKLIVGIIIILFTSPMIVFAWSPLPVWSGWDGSTTWNTDMPPDAPGIPTGDQIISTWDNEVRLSDELRLLFMYNQVLEIGGVWKDGKLGKECPYVNPPSLRGSEIEKKTNRIITDIAMLIWLKFNEPLICVFYYPHFEAFSIYLEDMKDVKRHVEIARYLESKRAANYNTHLW
jgi:hypothetical protein